MYEPTFQDIIFKAPCTCNALNSGMPEIIGAKDTSQAQLIIAITKCKKLDGLLKDLYDTLELPDKQWTHITGISICFLEDLSLSAHPCQPIGDPCFTITDWYAWIFIEAIITALPNVSRIQIGFNLETLEREFSQSYIEEMALFSQFLIERYLHSLRFLECSLALNICSISKYVCLSNLTLNVARTSENELFSCISHHMLKTLKLTDLTGKFDWGVLNRLKLQGIDPLYNVETLEVEYAYGWNDSTEIAPSATWKVLKETEYVCIGKLQSVSVTNYPLSANYFSKIGYCGKLVDFALSGTLDEIYRTHWSIPVVDYLRVRITEIPEGDENIFYGVTADLFSDTSRVDGLEVKEGADLHIVDQNFKLSLARVEWTNLHYFYAYCCVDYVDISDRLIRRNKCLYMLHISNVYVDTSAYGQKRLRQMALRPRHRENCFFSKLTRLELDFSKNGAMSKTCQDLLLSDLEDMVKSLTALEKLALDDTFKHLVNETETFRYHLYRMHIELTAIED